MGDFLAVALWKSGAGHYPDTVTSFLGVKQDGTGHALVTGLKLASKEQRLALPAKHWSVTRRDPRSAQPPS